MVSYDDGDENDCDDDCGGHGDLDSGGDDGFGDAIDDCFGDDLDVADGGYCCMWLLCDDCVNRGCADVGCYRIDNYGSWKSVSERSDKFPPDIQSSNNSHSGLGCWGSVAVGLGYLLLGVPGVQGHPNYGMKLQPFALRHTHTHARSHLLPSSPKPEALQRLEKPA